MHGSSGEEFPLLSYLGLYAADIRGDGNCLFNALSDQLYGSESEHAVVRARVIEYMREHSDYYKQFIDVHPGGGIRRNPKRKNAGAYSTPANAAPPSQADIDRVFESHLQNMARGGTYGDNMEITAFSCAYDVDVKIYQRDFAYMVTGGGDEPGRKVAHIAYHIWEHYSSIRNLDGPHTGLPHVSLKVLSPEEEAKQRERLQQAPHVLPWQIDVVSKSLPFLADKPTIKRALEAARGDINAAVSHLLDLEEYGSTSSQQESSSVERDHDSDDDMHDAPHKKQDRRLSRVSRVQKARSASSRHALAQIALYDGSQESITSWTSSASSLPDGSQQQSPVTQPTEPGDDDDNEDEDTDSGGKKRKKDPNPPVASSILEDNIIVATNTAKLPPPAPSKPPIRLKLHPPKPPDPSLNRRLPSFSSSSPARGVMAGGAKTQQRQLLGPRLQSARDRKHMQKQAQKAARKERSKGGGGASSLSVSNSGQSRSPPSRANSPSKAKLVLRAKSLLGGDETPPVETLRTLYI